VRGRPACGRPRPNLARGSAKFFNAPHCNHRSPQQTQTAPVRKEAEIGGNQAGCREKGAEICGNRVRFRERRVM
ncbi:MAG: hypothetical protein GX338_09985, partial [Firmicutes bacterium]|nr:hypothetical protein [Bacillota bacterium]